MDPDDVKASSSEEAISSDEEAPAPQVNRAPDAAGLVLAALRAAGAPLAPKDLAQRARAAAELFGERTESFADIMRTLAACGALAPFTRPPPPAAPLSPAKQARLEEDGARLYHASRIAPFHARAFDLARDGRFEELEAACGTAAATTLRAWCFHVAPTWADLRRKRLRRLDARGLRTARVALLACRPGLQLTDNEVLEPASPLGRVGAQLGLGRWGAPPQASAAQEWREEMARRRAGGLSSDGAACDSAATPQTVAPPSLVTSAPGVAPRLAAAARAVAALARARAKLACARDRDAAARGAFVAAGAEAPASGACVAQARAPPPTKKRASGGSSKKKKKRVRLDPPPPPLTEDDLALKARLEAAAARPTPPSADAAPTAPAPAASAGAAAPALAAPPLAPPGPAPMLREGDDASALTIRAHAADAPAYRPSRRPPAAADARRLLHDLAPATFDAGRRGAMAPPPGGGDADAAAWRRVSALVEGAAAVAAARRGGGAWSPAASPHNAAMSPRGRRPSAPSPPPVLNLPGLALGSPRNVLHAGAAAMGPRDLPAPDAARLSAPYGGPSAGAGARARAAAAASRARGDHDKAAALGRNAVVLREMKRDIEVLLEEAQVAPPT